MRQRIQTHVRASSSIVITVDERGEADVFRDVIWLRLPFIPAGTLIDGHLALQLENPSACPDNIGWLRGFVLRLPSGADYLMWETPENTNGMLGTNITRADHYFSTPESFRWVAPQDIPEGSIIAYRGRANTARAYRYYMKVWPKCLFTIDLEFPNG